MDQLALMKVVAEKAVDENVKSNSVIALGTGRTASFAVKRVGQLLKEGKLENITAISTSVQTFELIKELNIPYISIDDAMSSNLSIEVAIDGADAVDPNLNLIKGAGGALFREFLVEQYAKEFVVIVDESKMCTDLLSHCKVPIEVVNFGHLSTCKLVYNTLKEHIAEWSVRKGADGSTFITDNGNVIMDVKFSGGDVDTLHRKINEVCPFSCVSTTILSFEL
ncbi:ribose-5-phosphate isomerase, putative [Theileria equi strain WA]|uniref:ribose-5-phosphate isomerase n=1 Tax=Theileria equi strain WA TaxID=1537102 RepID=L1LDK9_THEEQ|nr:ribose-5-phosphate isomerase, putative [Theileria equi strain WA]EKX73325.1 ribose-5-phosphate isomerase, putative [Theileria equi strain WA]|eukprot:XP_004832777.1 ribose-5-phosphate isomerase, putative [Theileria equi strain WA]